MTAPSALWHVTSPSESSSRACAPSRGRRSAGARTARLALGNRLRPEVDEPLAQPEGAAWSLAPWDVTQSRALAHLSSRANGADGRWVDLSSVRPEVQERAVIAAPGVNRSSLALVATAVGSAYLSACRCSRKRPSGAISYRDRTGIELA